MCCRLGSALITALLVLLVSAPAYATSIVIVNKDAAGVGFNDPTVVAAVGGNSGTTLGQQRLNVFQAAANIWAAKLSSPFTIKITAQWLALTPCSASSGVLGQAGPTGFYVNFTNAPKSNTYYPIALASALANSDFAAADPLSYPDGESIDAQFNVNVGTSTCLTNGFYLGLDGNHGSKIDLETVLLHEFGHGLGFTGLVNTADGTFPGNTPDIYSFFTYDNSVFMHWNVMTSAERLTSEINNGNVVLDGTNVTSGASILSAGKDGSGHPKVYVPSSLQPGSSIYHFDTSASPNQLMEPAINSDLTHNVDLPSDLTTSLMKDIGWPTPSAVSPPTNVAALTTGATTVSVTWTAPAGTPPASYRVYRSGDHTNYTLVGSPTTTNFTDTSSTGVSSGKSYLYKVHSYNGSESGDSNVDFATTVVFTDPTLTAQSTLIKAAHISELRTAANALSTLAAGTPATTTFTDDPLVIGTTQVKATHISQLRTAINNARVALGFGLFSFTNSTLTPGSSTINAIDISELRTAVK